MQNSLFYTLACNNAAQTYKLPHPSFTLSRRWTGFEPIASVTVRNQHLKVPTCTIAVWVLNMDVSEVRNKFILIQDFGTELKIESCQWNHQLAGALDADWQSVHSKQQRLQEDRQFFWTPYSALPIRDVCGQQAGSKWSTQTATSKVGANN